MYNVEGIVYKVLDYNENDKLLFVLTRTGKITLVAKGARKLRSKTRLISEYLTKISFKNRPNKYMYTLMDYELLDSYEFIKKDFHKIKDISLILEVIDRFIGYDNNYKRIYNILDKALTFSNTKEIKLAFLVKILYDLGYGFYIEKSNKPIKGFSLSKSKLIFIGDKDNNDLSPNLSKLLINYIYKPFEDIPKLNEKEYNLLFNFIKKYYEYHIQPLKNI